MKQLFTFTDDGRRVPHEPGWGQAIVVTLMAVAIIVLIVVRAWATWGAPAMAVVGAAVIGGTLGYLWAHRA